MSWPRVSTSNLSCMSSPPSQCLLFDLGLLHRFSSYLDAYGGSEPTNIFHCFSREFVILLHLNCLPCSGSCCKLVISVCWRSVNNTPVSKGPLSPLVENYRLVSITTVLSMVYERLVLARLGWIFESICI